jgi:hypothetical protein
MRSRVAPSVERSIVIIKWNIYFFYDKKDPEVAASGSL